MYYLTWCITQGVRVTFYDVIMLLFLVYNTF